MGSRVASINERELIALACGGDEFAWQMLFEKHYRRIYCLCLRMVSSVQDAEDYTQETFLQVFRKLSTFRGQSAFSTWLHIIAVNVIRMKLRKQRRMPLLHSMDAKKNDQESGDNLSFEHGALDRRQFFTVECITLTRAISNLPQGYRTIYFLHEVEERTHSEIAKLLECSEGTSKSQCHKAKMKLRDILAPQEKKAIRQSI